MGGPTRPQQVGGVEAVTGQAQEPGDGRVRGALRGVDVLGEVGDADVRHEADGHLRHGGRSALGDHAVRAVQRNAQATAHGDAVDDGDVRLRELGDGRVHLVLLQEEGVARGVIARHVGLADLADVTAGAEIGRASCRERV